jgi:hypothetical protein
MYSDRLGDDRRAAGAENSKACLWEKEDSTSTNNLPSGNGSPSNVFPPGFLKLFPFLKTTKTFPIEPSKDVKPFLSYPVFFNSITLDSKGRLTYFFSKRLENGHVEILKIQKEVSPFFF